MYAAAVCVLMMHRVFGPAQEMPTAHTEATAKSCASLGALVVGTGVCRRILRSLAQSGVLALVLGCMLLLSVC
jgi:hypothetical protein